MSVRRVASLLLASLILCSCPAPAVEAEKETIDIEAGPIWSNDDADKVCPEVAARWTAENPGRAAEWTGGWNTTVPGEMSVCTCEIVEGNGGGAPAPEPVPPEVEVGRMDVPGADLRTRRGYAHAWIREDEGVSVLYFIFDNGVLQFYRDEPSMGYVSDIDLSGLPRPLDMDDPVFDDIDGDGYADLTIPLPDGGTASWRWIPEDWRFEPTATSRLLPASAKTRKTLGALPAWTAPHLLVHVGELSAVMGRLGGSWLLDFAMDVRPERRPVLDWLRSFPVESASLVKGLPGDGEDVFHGALRFNDDKRDILAELAELSPSSDDDEIDALGKMHVLFFRLLDVPPALLRSGAVRVYGNFVEERENFFELDVHLAVDGVVETMFRVFASVADAGEEKLLLFASSPEDVERAGGALLDESARLEIVRSVPAKANYLRIVDAASESGGGELTDELYSGSHAPLKLELAAGLSDDGFELSLRHNLFTMLFGDYPRPDGAWRGDDRGFAFGGGRPWAAGAFSPALTGQNILDLLTAAAAGDADIAREFLARAGVDPAVFSEAVRSVGLVLGGNAMILDRPAPHPDAPVEEKWLPGGYVFASGDAEKMRSFAPMLKMLFAHSFGGSVREGKREGWDFFFELGEEGSAEVSGLPFFAGMRDGVFLAGILDKYYLEAEPEADWDAIDADGALLAGRLDMVGLIERARNLLAAVPLRKLREAADAIDLEDFFEPDEWAAAFKCFAALQETKMIRIDMPDWESVRLDVVTGPADYESVWDLVRTSRVLESGDEERF